MTIIGNEHHIIRTPNGEKVHLTRIVVNQPLKRENRPILKVVGASWFQTRVSSYIIAAMSLLGIVAIIMGELGSQYVEDRNYAATVFWRQKTNFKIEFWGQGNILQELPRGAAHAYFRPDIDKIGWSVLEIETSPNYPDWVQAYAAGLLEGSLTWQSIYFQWKNTIDYYCTNHESECDQIREFLKENEEIIRSLAVTRENEPYWHQVRLYYAQIDGLETGWNYAVKRSRQDYEIPAVDFLWLNSISDLNDLKRKFNIPVEEVIEQNPGLSTSFLKMHKNEGLEELYLAHNTAANYGEMFRILKHYDFNFHLHADPRSPIVPGTRITFTSYPGAISSHDDFYNIKSKAHNLAVTGTSLNVLNKNLWLKVDSESIILQGPRVMAANRLSVNGKQWAETIGFGDVGTGNKLWMVANLNEFQNGERNKGLLWLVEQIPGKTNSSDMTKEFIENGYWATYGVPYFKYIHESSDTYQMELTNPEFSYKNSKKAQYFSNNHQICNSFHDTLSFMRNVTTKLSITDVALRGDLVSNNPYGVIDTKAVTINNQKVFNLQVISGPPHTQIDELALLPSNQTSDMVLPFQWSQSQLTEVPHLGQPDLWKFQAVRPQWIWGG